MRLTVPAIQSSGPADHRQLSSQDTLQLLEAIDAALAENNLNLGIPLRGALAQPPERGPRPFSPAA